MDSQGPHGPEVPVTYTVRLSDDADPTEITVVTPAFASAFRYVDAYLRTGTGELGESGRAVAVIGDLGSGKTHLARSMLDRIGRQQEDAILLRLDMPHSEFGYLFRNVLIEQFGRERLHGLVIDYYADVTAARIGEDEAGPELVEEIKEGLRAGALDPRKVIEHFHLTKAALLDELRLQLRHLTDHSLWATALALMVRDELAGSVWEWLSGGALTDELRAAGVKRQLTGTADAYHTLSVLAFLGGRMNRRMVLVIDEFQKLLGREDAVNSFEELVKVFIDTQGLLVYCGPPDSIAHVTRGTLQRTRVLTPTAFGREQTAELIENRGGRITAAVAECLVEMTDGNPREILSLHRSAEAIAGARSVSPSTVRDAVRQRHEFPVQDVRVAVRRLLEDSGLDFRSDVVLAADIDPIDFWVRYADGRAAVAVLITRSLLSQGDDVHLERRVGAAKASEVPCELIAVVNGHLTGAIRLRISNLIGRQPLVYDVQDFTRKFRETLDTAVKRLAASADESELDGLRRRMDRLSRQQSATQNMIDQLHESVAGLRTTALADPGARSDAPALPAPVAEQFERAAAVTESTGELGRLLRDVFDNRAGSENSLRARRRLSSRELVEAAGAAMVQRLLVEAFRERVAAFMEGAHGRLGPEQEEELQAICRTFEVTVQSLPSAGLSEVVPANTLEQGARSQARAERVRVLDELGRRVLKGVQASARP